MPDDVFNRVEPESLAHMPQHYTLILREAYTREPIMNEHFMVTSGPKQAPISEHLIKEMARASSTGMCFSGYVMAASETPVPFQLFFPTFNEAKQHIGAAIDAIATARRTYSLREL